MAWVVPYAFPWDVRIALTDNSPAMLLSVDPEERWEDEPWIVGPPAYPLLAGRRILGTTLLTAPEKRRLVQAMFAGMASHMVPIEANCFNPRHALQVSHAGVTYDILICFECLQVYVVQAGDQRDRIAKLLIDGWPKPVFDDMLTAHHVPLSPKD
jgi:hypothetical protein